MSMKMCESCESNPQYLRVIFDDKARFDVCKFCLNDLNDQALWFKLDIVIVAIPRPVLI